MNDSDPPIAMILEKLMEQNRLNLAMQWMLGDLLAELAVLHPDPAKFLDDRTMRFHASMDAALPALRARGASPEVLAENERTMQVARGFFEKLQKSAHSMLDSGQKPPKPDE